MKRAIGKLSFAHTFDAWPTRVCSNLFSFMRAQNFKTVIVIFVIKGAPLHSAYTATFETFVCTPRIRLQNFKCSFSAKVMILKNLLLNCWGLAISPKVLAPQTSQPYGSTGATTQSNNFKRTLTGVLPTLKVTVHVGTDQNIENEIFAEYKYILNELLVTKLFFNTFNSLRDMMNESFYQK